MSLLDRVNPRLTGIERWYRRRREARWARLRESQNRVVVRLESGSKLVVPTESSLAAGIYLGNFERSERDFLRRFLRPHDCFWDIGANIGLFSHLAGAYLTRGSVVALEPLPEAFAVLQENLRPFNERSYAFQAAAGAADGHAKLYADNGLDPFASLVETDMPTNALAVAVTTLDGLQEREGLPHPTLLKLDCEGSELSVVAGASRLLTTAPQPTLLVEFNEKAARAAGTSSAALRQKLELLGYTLHSYRRRPLGPPWLGPLAPAECYPDQNVIATPHAQTLRSRLGLRQA